MIIAVTFECHEMERMVILWHIFSIMLVSFSSVFFPLWIHYSFDPQNVFNFDNKFSGKKLSVAQIYVFFCGKLLGTLLISVQRSSTQQIKKSMSFGERKITTGLVLHKYSEVRSFVYSLLIC